jgi:hypothetical protein
MPAPVLTRMRTPFDDFPAEAVSEFAAFVRAHAPRWVRASRSLSLLMARRAQLQSGTRYRRRGICCIPAPAPVGGTALRRRP